MKPPRARAAPGLVGRLIRTQLGAIAATWTLLVVWLTFTMMQLGQGDLDRRMMSFARVLAESASQRAPEFPDTRQAIRLHGVAQAFVGSVIEDLNDESGYQAHYLVRRTTGGIVAVGSPGDATLLSGQSRFGETTLAGQRWRLATATSADGTVEVVVGETMAAHWQGLLPTLKVIGLGQLLIFVVCLLFLWWAARHSLGGVLRLSSALGARSDGNLTPLPLAGLPREVAQLVASLNQLLAAEARHVTRQHAFLMDAAHELRTPLAAIAIQAHQLAGVADADVRVAAAARLQNGIGRVSHLANQLLTLAGAEQETAQTFAANSAEAARLALATLVLLVDARQGRLALDAPDTLPAALSIGEWQTVLTNLVGNAVQHGRVGVRITVQLSATANGLTLIVEDDGPGIPYGERGAALDRFRRLSGSQGTGSGLGLPIVKALVERRRGSIWLEDAQPGSVGLRVVIDLPLLDRAGWAPA